MDYPNMKPTLNNLGQCIGFPLPNWVAPPLPPREPMKGRFCRLEPLDLDHERSWTYLAYGPFSDFASYRAWLRANCLGDDPLFFTIIDTADGRPAGVASYLRITPAAGSIEVGHIHYALRLKRRPAATEAMYLMMQRPSSLATGGTNGNATR